MLCRIKKLRDECICSREFKNQEASFFAAEHHASKSLVIVPNYFGKAFLFHHDIHNYKKEKPTTMSWKTVVHR